MDGHHRIMERGGWETAPPLSEDRQCHSQSHPDSTNTNVHAIEVCTRRCEHNRYKPHICTCTHTVNTHAHTHARIPCPNTYVNTHTNAHFHPSLCTHIHHICPYTSTHPCPVCKQYTHECTHCALPHPQMLWNTKNSHALAIHPYTPCRWINTEITQMQTHICLISGFHLSWELQAITKLTSCILCVAFEHTLPPTPFRLHGPLYDHLLCPTHVHGCTSVGGEGAGSPCLSPLNLKWWEAVISI